MILSLMEAPMIWSRSTNKFILLKFEVNVVRIKFTSSPQSRLPEDVNLVLSWYFSANQNRAFYMQRLANLIYIKRWGWRILTWSIGGGGGGGGGWRGDGGC